MDTSTTIADLQATIPTTGSIATIVVRPGRREPTVTVDEVEARPGVGLVGDHRAARQPTRVSKRQVTLVMAEHLDAVATLLHRDTVDPLDVRRNLVVRGLNLGACRDRDLRVGEVVLRVTGPCHPCSRMEEVLGPGGYQAMRGHGGMTATITTGGTIRVGDEVALLPPEG